MSRKDRLSVSNQTLLYLTVALAYLTKFVLYRYLVDLDDGLNVWQGIGAYAIVAGASVLIAMVGQITAKYWATILVMCLMDVWLFANILYHNANGVFIDWQVILFANALRGFEDSITAYLDWKQFIIPLVTIAVVVFLVTSKPAMRAEQKNGWKYWTIVAATGIVLCLAGRGIGTIGDRLAAREAIRRWSIRAEDNLFIQSHSPIGHLGRVLWNGIQERILHVRAVRPLTEQDKRILSTIYTDSVPPAKPEGHLVFVLVESFESWALQQRDLDSVEVCASLNNFIRTHDVLFCPNVISQQKYGRSGDGQLITQTGMLPLSSGITCMTFGKNVYPNFAHFYPNSVILNAYPGVWNQRTTTKSYGYKRLREPHKGHRGTDSLLFCQIREELEAAQEPTCVLTLTINTHVPFSSVPPTLRFGDDLAPIEAKYLQTVHYMDKHLGRFLAWADTAAIMQNSTIIITADHNHFPERNGKGRCPLVIWSPSITQTLIVPLAYQMDIFPTTLDVIGQSNYAWHGFGIDLLDVSAKRRILPKQAYSLSDKMIRNNFFATQK